MPLRRVGPENEATEPRIYPRCLRLRRRIRRLRRKNKTFRLPSEVKTSFLVAAALRQVAWVVPRSMRLF